MSLAVRLLLALGAVAVFVTALVGFSAREVARRQVERGFQQRMDAATRGAADEAVWEAGTLAELLTPLCQHDSFVDQALLDLERVGGRLDKLPPGRGIALQRLVPEQRKALRLDGLMLVTGDGSVIAASDPALAGGRDRTLANRLKQTAGRPRLRRRGGEATIEVHCTRESNGVTVGLVGWRKVAPMLQRISRAYGVALAIDEGGALGKDHHQLVRKLPIQAIQGLTVRATISRQPLFDALDQMDESIFLTGAIAVLLSVALAVFVARGLSQPIVELATEARRVVQGEPKPVRARGGRELNQLARSFNRTIDELTSMRKRLARTERIAARREVARQVAHEIKNPLAPIRAAVETLRRLRARDSPHFDDYFDEATKTVLGEVHRIKTIVSEFSKFARMPPPRFERVDVAELARGVVGLHDVPGDFPRVSLHADALPPVLADADQLVQVLTNLVQNGLEAAVTTRDDPEVTVTLKARGDSEIVLVVQDNGPGVSPEVAQRLFEPYVSTKPEGTGLGLAIVQTILHEHGGDIRQLPDASPGACFEVTLPVDGPPLLQIPPDATGELT